MRQTLKRALTAVLLLLGATAFLLRNEIRTLASFRRVPGTQMYVLDYYGSFALDDLRENGVDGDHIEESILRAYFPDAIESLFFRLIPEGGVVRSPSVDPVYAACSTVSYANDGGDTTNGDIYFGRNLDWNHDPLLVVQTHSRQHPSTVAVLDFAYLDMDADKLARLSWLDRLPLLLAPYIVMDGANEYGVAIAEMTVWETELPYDPAKPSLYNSLLQRLILEDARTVDDAIAIIERYNVVFPETPCHFLIADASGRSVVVEFVAGEIQVVEADADWQVATNHQLYGRTEAENRAHSDRYRSAATSLEALDAPMDFDRLAAIMGDVSQPTTMWTTLHNLSTGEFRIAYRQDFGNVYEGRLRGGGD